MTGADRFFEGTSKVSVRAPAQVVLATVPIVLSLGLPAAVEPSEFEISRHPPPGGLYTMYRSFLI
jgi:hypothetical protein